MEAVELVEGDPARRRRGEPPIVAEGLVRRFGDVEAVAGIDLEVGDGEIFGFLGPNGAGKSTTVRILTTLLRPTAGVARVAGHDVVREADAVRRSIGVALQEAALDPLMTGRELLRLQGVLHGIDREEGRRRAEELLETVGLTAAADRRVGTYSGGMRRRLDLALALVHRPEVMFLDEPTTGLDPNSRLALWDEIREMNRSGTTVFLTTQYMEEADRLARRVAIIDGGRIVAAGTPAQLKADVGDPTLRVALGDGADPAGAESALTRFGDLVEDATGYASVRLRGGAARLGEVSRVLDAEGIAIEGLELHTPTLDDVFHLATGKRLEGAAGEAATDETATDAERRVSASAQYVALSRRSIVGTIRQPAAMFPALLFPLIFTALNAAALNESIHLPGFPPVESFLQFVIASTVVQGALFGAISAGSDMATDVQDGFFERLIASPVARTSILAGRVAGAAALGFVQAWFFIGVAMLFGLTVDGGFAGVLGVSAVAAVLAAGSGALMMAFGLRTGSAEAVQGAFPLLFTLLFFSSAFFPRELMEGWFETVASINPMSHLIEGLRHQVIAGLDVGELLIALAVAAGLLAIGLAASGLALRRRLAGAS